MSTYDASATMGLVVVGVVAVIVTGFILCVCA